MDITSKDMARAVRRQHLLRLKKVRSVYFNHTSFGKNAMTNRQKGMAANTAQMCSCYMCGNPRKWFTELTMQEQRFSQHSINEMLMDI